MTFKQITIDIVSDIIQSLNNLYTSWSIGLLHSDKDHMILLFDSLTSEVEYTITIAYRQDGIQFSNDRNNDRMTFQWNNIRITSQLWWNMNINKYLYHLSTLTKQLVDFLLYTYFYSHWLLVDLKKWQFQEFGKWFKGSRNLPTQLVRIL